MFMKTCLEDTPSTANLPPSLILKKFQISFLKNPNFVRSEKSYYLSGILRQIVVI